jgi:hypothetical protein
MARERIDRHTLRLLREIGLPEISEAQIESLAARLREAYAAEHAKTQIGADPRMNVGGDPETLDGLEDGAPPIVMLEQCESP